MNDWFRQRRRYIAGSLFLVLACVWSLTLAQPCDSHTNIMGMNGGVADHGYPYCPPSHQDNMYDQDCSSAQCSMERSDNPASVNVESASSHDPVKLVTRLSASDELETTYFVAVAQPTLGIDILEPPLRLQFCTLLI